MSSAVLERTNEFDNFLELEQRKEMLRLTTAGSVDDGKSTLIGRLLYDSRSVYEDQLESVAKASAGRNAGAIDFSLLTDGLRAEREQGITIDVAYRYFATPKRKFIIADTPGHEQYTRNMVTGASTAELAIILIDARKGVLPQSKRHAYIASLLGLPHVVIAVNKMDLVGYSQAVFQQIETEFRAFLARFQSLEPYFLPISALAGDNVVEPSSHMPWFAGLPMLNYLEQVPVHGRVYDAPFRFPVQRVVRPTLDFRGYAGTVSSGGIHKGQSVTVLPAGTSARVESIVTFDGEQDSAGAGEAVTLTLDREVDVARGDVLAASNRLPMVDTAFAATLVWLNEQPLRLRSRYRLKQAARQEWAEVRRLEHRVNINTLDEEAAGTLEMNGIGVVEVSTARALAFDSYRDNRTTGSFILIDPVTNATVAAGMVTGPAQHDKDGYATGPVTAAERIVRRGHTGCVVRLGGRTELAWRLERLVFERNASVVVLADADPVTEQALMKAGLLVVVTGHSGQPFEIETVSGGIKHGESLPVGDSDAAKAIEGMLLRMQVVLPTALNESGEGI